MSWITDAAVWEGIVVTPPFVPTDIAGLEAWWDAADTGTIVHTTNTVTGWADKSGNSHDLIQAGAPRPTTNVRTINGLNALDFNSDYMSTGHTFWYALGAATGSTMFLVILPDGPGLGAGGVGNAVYEIPSSGTVQHYGFRYNATISVATYRPNNNVLQFNQSSADIVTGAAHFVAMTDSGTTSILYVDNASGVSQAYTRSAMTISTFVVGGYPNEGTMVDGAIAEILIYDTVLSAPDFALVKDYLNVKWALGL